MRGLIGLGMIVIALIIALLWIFMPFLIMGTNKRLDKLSELLEAAEESSARQREEQLTQLNRVRQYLKMDREDKDNGKGEGAL